MTTTCLAAACGRPVRDGYVCPACMKRHDDLLLELDDLAQALEAAFLKQQRFSVAHLARVVGDDRDESPLPFDATAGRLRRRLSRVLLDTVRQVARHNRPDVDVLGYPASLGYAAREPVHITPRTAAMAAYLRQHRTWFAGTPAGAAAVNTFAELRALALAAVDRPPDLVFLGICSTPAKEGKPFEVRRNGRTVRYTECPEDVYADQDIPTVTCLRCKTEHAVERRRTILAAALNDQLATAPDISRGLSALDMHVTAERIRQWKTRKRLAQRGTTGGVDPHTGEPVGHPTYRVGDVIDLVLATDIRNTQPPRRNPS